MKTIMTNQLSRILVVLMATLVGLAGVGLGYGLWQDKVKINVGVASPVGQITCFGFSQISGDDEKYLLPSPPYPVGTYNYSIDHTVTSPIYEFGDSYHRLGTQGGDPPAKDVGWTNFTSTNADASCGDELIEVTVGNGYPSYASLTAVTFKNYGTTSGVVVTAEGIGMPPTPGYYLDYYSPVVVGIQHAKCYWLKKDLAPAGPGAEDPAVLDVCWENFEGVVVQPGSTTAGVLKLHVLQPADEGAEYKFYVWVEVWTS